MNIVKKLTLGVSLLSVALSTGFLMENSAAIAGYFEKSPPPALSLSVREIVAPNPIEVPAFELVSLAKPLPSDPESTLLGVVQADGLARRMALVEARQPTGLPQSHQQISAFGLPCAVDLTATAKESAMVTLTLNAPCSTGAVVTIEHEALKFSLLTDATGEATVSVPALAVDARFEAMFDNGVRVVAQVEVADLVEYDRVALFWQGRPGMHIHAFENGAAYGSAGHLSAENPSSVTGSAFLTALGSGTIPGGWSAEVFTVSNQASQSGVFRMTIESEVTAQTCAREISAKTLQLGSAPVDLTLSIPGCDAIGDFLVLKNILHDIKLAAN